MTTHADQGREPLASHSQKLRMGQGGWSCRKNPAAEDSSSSSSLVSSR